MPTIPSSIKPAARSSPAKSANHGRPPVHPSGKQHAAELAAHYCAEWGVELQSPVDCSESRGTFVWRARMQAIPFPLCLSVKRPHRLEAPFYLGTLAGSGCVPRLIHSADTVVEGERYEVMCLEFLQPLSPDDAVLSSRSAAEWITQMADVLAGLQRANIIHRDIKPTNLGIGSDGLLKIFDFELAIPATDVENHPRPCGTKGYQAPETQLEPASYSFASDMFSMGCTLDTMVRSFLVDFWDDKTLLHTRAIMDMTDTCAQHRLTVDALYSLVVVTDNLETI